MTAAPPLTTLSTDLSRTARVRLGHYYLRVLRSAALILQRGQESTGAALADFDHDLAQISQWWEWSASLAATNQDVAQLFLKVAVAGLDILAIRQHPQGRIRWLASALDIARQLGDAKSAHGFLYYLYLAHAQLGALDGAEGYARQLYDSARATRDRLSEGRSLCALGSLTEDRGDYEAAERLLKHSLDILTRLGDERHASEALKVLGAIALYRGQTAQAVNYFTRCLEIAERQGRPNDIAAALLALAQATQYPGQLEQCGTYIRRAIALCRALGNRRLLSGALVTLGNWAVESGDVGAACGHYREALHIARSVAYRQNIIHTLSCLGYAEYRNGAYDEAIAHLAEGLALAEQPMQPRFVCNILRNVAYVHIARGDVEPARAAICRGLRVARSLNSDSQKRRTMLGAVLLGAHQGAHEQAVRWAGVIQGDPDVDSALLDRACDELRSALGARRYQRALTQGGAMGLDAAIDDILTALGG